MRASDDLHRLIHSLTKPEKRNFRLMSSRYEGQEKNNYLKLFDIIEKQIEYDEDAIKAGFKGQNFVKHLPSEKNYLYNLILDTLFQAWSDASDEQRLRTRIQHAALLLARGLPEQSQKLLRKARETAERMEMAQAMLEVLQLEKQLLTRSYFTGVDEAELQRLFSEEAAWLNRMSEANAYWLLFSRFYRLHYRKGSSRDQDDLAAMDEIMSHPLLRDYSRASSYRTRLDFLHIHALYHFMKGNLEEAYTWNSRYLELLESQPDMLKLYSKRYLATLNNYLMDSLGLHQYVKVEEGLRKMRELPQKFSFYRNKQTSADIFRLSYMLEMNLFIKTGRFQEGMAIIPQIEEGLEAHQGVIVRHTVLTLHYQAAYVLFGAERYSEAVRWLSRILNDSGEPVLEDLHAFARLFNLILHFELKNYDILDHLILSALRFLSHRTHHFQAEAKVLKYMKKIVKLDEKQQIRAQWQKLHQELLPLAQDPVESKAFDYLDLIHWLEAKLDGKPFSAVIQGTALAAQA